MNGDPKVMAALQEAINMEASLAATYYLNGTVLKAGLGVKTGKELKGLGKQCCSFKDQLIKCLLLLGGTPEIAPDTAEVEETVTATLDGLLALEEDIVAKYTEFSHTCWDADDMAHFHFMQHLCKWHTKGGNGYDGHIHYLKHEKTQLAALGEHDYIASHI